MATNYKGKVVSDGLILYHDYVNPKSLIQRQYSPSIINMSSWAEGGTGNTEGYNANGAATENHRIVDTDPFGNQSVVWEAHSSNAGSDSDGGWVTSSFPVDNTKKYRFSVWMYRKVTGTDGAYYFGMDAYGSVNGVKTITGSTNTNPYFTSGSSPDGGHIGVGWTLLVGVIHPHDIVDLSADPDIGYYTIADGKISASINTFQWLPETTTALHRAFLYYCTDPTVKQQFFDPRVDICDGNEPSIQDLLDNRANQIKNLMDSSVSRISNAPIINEKSISLQAKDSIIIPNTNYPTLMSDPFTIETWIKIPSSADWTTPYFGNIIGRGATYGSHGLVRHTVDNTIIAWIRPSSSGGGVYAQAPIQRDVWHHCVMTWNAYIVKLYIDGILIAEDSTVGADPTSNFINDSLDNNDWQIGGSKGFSGSSGSGYIGEIGLTRIYQKDLSLEEVIVNFSSQKGRYK